MLTIELIGKIGKKEVSKKFLNNITKTKIALIQMKMSSEPKKNISHAISKILLANKIESNFMTNTDQQNVINAIRNSSSNDQLRNYQNNKMVNSIILGYSVVNQKSMKYSTGYINYIFLKKIKK